MELEGVTNNSKASHAELMANFYKNASYPLMQLILVVNWRCQSEYDQRNIA